MSFLIRNKIGQAAIYTSASNSPGVLYILNMRSLEHRFSIERQSSLSEKKEARGHALVFLPGT